MNQEHYIVKLINGYYCTLCYKFRKELDELEKELDVISR